MTASKTGGGECEYVCEIFVRFDSIAGGYGYWLSCRIVCLAMCGARDNLSNGWTIEI